MKRRSVLETSEVRGVLAALTPSLRNLKNHTTYGEPKHGVALQRTAATLIIELLDELVHRCFLPSADVVTDSSGGDDDTLSAKKSKAETAAVGEAETSWNRVLPVSPLHPLPSQGHELPLAASLAEYKIGDRVLSREERRVSALRLVSVANDIIFEAALLASSSPTHWIEEGEPISPTILRRAINSNDQLRSIFEHSSTLQSTGEPSLADLCATVVSLQGKEAYDGMNLPSEVLSLIESKSEARVLERLLERIDACIPELKSKRTPATEEEIDQFESKAFVHFSEELAVLYKWSNGVPDEAIGMRKFVSYARVSDVEEEFFYNVYFPTIFRQLRWIPIFPIDYDFCYNALDVATGMVVQIDNECQAYHLISADFIESVRAYVEELEKNKDNLASMENATPPKWLSGNKLSDEEPYLYQLFAKYGRFEED